MFIDSCWTWNGPKRILIFIYITFNLFIQLPISHMKLAPPSGTESKQACKAKLERMGVMMRPCVSSLLRTVFSAPLPTLPWLSRPEHQPGTKVGRVSREPWRVRWQWMTVGPEQRQTWDKTGAQMEAVADEQTRVHTLDSSCSISMWMVEVNTSPAVIVKFSFHVLSKCRATGATCTPKIIMNPTMLSQIVRASWDSPTAGLPIASMIISAPAFSKATVKSAWLFPPSCRPDC